MPDSDGEIRNQILQFHLTLVQYIRKLSFLFNSSFLEAHFSNFPKFRVVGRLDSPGTLLIAARTIRLSRVGAMDSDKQMQFRFKI